MKANKKTPGRKAIPAKRRPRRVAGAKKERAVEAQLKLPITVVKVKSALNRADREISTIMIERKTNLADIRSRHFPPDVAMVTSLNGQVIDEKDLPITYPCKRDCVTFVPRLEGGGTGKSILRGLLMIGVVVGSLFVPGLFGVTFAASPALFAAIAGAASMIGGLLVNTLLPNPAGVPTGDLKGLNSSQNYGWNPQTTQQQGIVVPKNYGTQKLYGNVISAFIENIAENKQNLNVLIDLGLGPFSRLYGFEINDQPVESFQGVDIWTRLGNMDQEVMPNFNDTKTEYSLNIKIVKDTPYTYTTVESDFNGIEVDITFPSGLWHAKDDGSLGAYSVDLRISIRKQGTDTWYPITGNASTTSSVAYNGKWSAGFWVPLLAMHYWHELAAGDTDPASHYDGEIYVSSAYPNKHCYWRWIAAANETTTSTPVDYDTVKDKKAAAIRRTYFAAIPDAAKGTYEIYVGNLTEDKTSTKYGDDMYLSAVREVYTDDFQYPRRVLVGIRALATDQLSGSLRFSCMADCSLVRVYDGENWSVQFSNNPAWVWFDVMTQPVFDNNLNVLRYDGTDPSRIDVAKVLEWATYCDDLVPDENGEKRVTFNGGFDTELDPWRAGLQVCQIGRAMPVPTGINITIVIDKPRTMVQIFTTGNIATDSFEEDWLPMEDRAAELEIDFVNSEKDYDRDKFTVVNEGVDNNVNKVNLQLFGLTKPSEVWRAGMLRLYKNQYMGRTTQIKADIDAIACTIGDLVGIQHDRPRWGDGNRLVSATSDTVTLDQALTIEAAKSYQILIRLSDDSLVIKTIVNPGNGSFSIFTVSTPFDPVPAKHDLYHFAEVDKPIKPHIVAQISRSGEQQVTLSCVEYNETIYNCDTDQPALPTPNYSALDPLPAVTNLKATEIAAHLQDGTLVNQIVVNFEKPSNDTAYLKAQIWYQAGDDVWKKAGETNGREFTIGPGGTSGGEGGGWGSSPWEDFFWMDDGGGASCTVAVLSVNKAGAVMKLQNAPTYIINPSGDAAVPDDISGSLTGTGKGKTWAWSWTKSTAANVNKYHVQIATDSSFTAVVKYYYVGGNSASHTDDARDYGTLYCRVKGVTDSGIESLNWSGTGSATTAPMQTDDHGDLSVTTPKIADDAVTALLFVRTAGTINLTQNDWTQVQVGTFPATGENSVKITCFCAIYNGAGSAKTVSLRLKNGDTVVDELDDLKIPDDHRLPFNWPTEDASPSVGDNVYSFEVYTPGTAQVAEARIIEAKENKK